jgi:hypothetical protein
VPVALYVILNLQLTDYGFVKGEGRKVPDNKIKLC